MKKIPRTIGLAFNVKNKSLPGDPREEYDEPKTINAITLELKRHGFKVVRLEQDKNFILKVRRLRPDFVFNIAEGRGSFRSRESQVPGILESLGIPYSGSDPVSLGITLDKYLTHQLLRSAGVPVARTRMISQSQDCVNCKKIFRGSGRFIVKPRWEGSSRGIFNNSVVATYCALQARVDFILKELGQPALIEEFLPNDEVTCGVYGNSYPQILGMMRIRPARIYRTPFLYSKENKRDWRTKIKYDPGWQLSDRVRSLIEAYALRAFKALELRDIARIDFRLDRNNIPKIIDINPLPGLSPDYSDLPILHSLYGGTYSSLIALILRSAFTRYGIPADQPLFDAA